MTLRRPLFHGQLSLFALPQQYPPQSVTLFCSGKVVQEILEPIFRRMLHHDDMREVAGLVRHRCACAPVHETLNLLYSCPTGCRAPRS